jgi:hypothetical protein
MNVQFFNDIKTPLFTPQYSNNEQRKRTSNNSRMLIQDVSNLILPLRTRSNKYPNYNISIKGDLVAKNSVKLLLTTLNRSQYSEKDLTTLLAKAIRNITEQLISQGTLILEINSHEGGHILFPYSAEKIRTFGPIAFQYIPKKYRKNKILNIGTKHRIFKLQIPESLGGSRQFSRIKRQLGLFDNVSPRFVLAKIYKGGLSFDFDTKKYHNDVQNFHMAQCNLWGWSLRGSSSGKHTDFYMVYRRIKFFRALAYIREHIVSELNQLFVRLGIDASIILEGLPNSVFYSMTLENLSKGKIKLKEATDLCFT